MKRGEVVERVVLMPMRIKTQREGDKLVAAMPSWRLPTGLIVEGRDTGDALDKLRHLMMQYWGVEHSNNKETGD